MVKFPVLKLFGTRYGERIQGGQGKALGPSGYRVGLRSQLLSGTGWGGVWEPVLEKEGGKMGSKVEVVELDLEVLLQGSWEQYVVDCGQKGQRKKKKNLNRDLETLY